MSRPKINESERKTTLIKFRVNRKQGNKIKGLAMIYSNGNVSDFCRWCVENYSGKIPDFLKKSPVMEESSNQEEINHHEAKTT